MLWKNIQYFKGINSPSKLNENLNMFLNKT